MRFRPFWRVTRDTFEQADHRPSGNLCTLPLPRLFVFLLLLPSRPLSTLIFLLQQLSRKSFLVVFACFLFTNLKSLQSSSVSCSDPWVLALFDFYIHPLTAILQQPSCLQLTLSNRFYRLHILKSPNILHWSFFLHFSFSCGFAKVQIKLFFGHLPPSTKRSVLISVQPKY